MDERWACRVVPERAPRIHIRCANVLCLCNNTIITIRTIVQPQYRRLHMILEHDVSFFFFNTTPCVLLPRELDPLSRLNVERNTQKMQRRRSLSGGAPHVPLAAGWRGIKGWSLCEPLGSRSIETQLQHTNTSLMKEILIGVWGLLMAIRCACVWATCWGTFDDERGVRPNRLRKHAREN